ncbi:MAG: HAD family hydrolase [Candidatus Hydrothermarchaeales archaeon]
MSIKVVSFDVDGTLVDHGFVDLFWEVGIPELYAEKEGIPFDQAKEHVMTRYGEVGEEDIRWYLPEFWFDDLGLKGDVRELLDKFKEEVRIFPEVPEVLEDLRVEYELIVLSNAAREFLGIELEEIESYFAHIFSSTSDFNQVRKTTDFYSKICQILGIEPSDMLHVGDHPTFDYIAPKKLGIEALYMDRTGKSTGEETIKDLREVKRKLMS